MTVPGQVVADGRTTGPSIDGYRLPALDAMRAVGSLAVLLTHVGFQTGASLHGRLGGLLARMDVGVALFFVLSGLLLVIPWAEQGLGARGAPSTRGYLWRRALRILPAYWVVVIAAFALVPANADASTSTFGANLALLQIYQPGNLVPGLTQTWSLCTEVAFYLALPLLGFLLARVLRRVGVPAALGVCGLLAAGGLLWIWFVQTSEVFDRSVAALWLPGYLPWFAPGMALGLLVVAAREGSWPRLTNALADLSASPWTVWTVALGLFLVASTPVAGPRGLTGFSSASEALAKSVLYAGVAVLVVTPAAFGTGTRTHRALSSRPMRWLGRVSYGLFLWHVLVLDIAFRSLDVVPFTGHFWLLLSFTLPVSLAVAWLSWVVIERPVQRLRSLVA